MRLPIPNKIRELWLPASINETARTLPTGINGGHELTLSGVVNTGASKRTTADGVRFTGVATSNMVIAAAAGQNAQTGFNITIRFKLDATFATGAASDLYLFQKLLAADDYIKVYLENADGKLYWVQGNAAGGVQFTLTSTTVSWTANTWYTITCSLTAVPTQRLLVNGTAEDTDTQAARSTPNGGDMVIGSSSDGGTDGIVGTISLVEIGVGVSATVALTATEETDLYKGIPPDTAKVQYLFTMDEGRGVIVYDRGSAGGNGTLDSACTWAFGSCRQPVLSLDGINDYTASAASIVDISGDLTLVWAGKIKSTYDSLAADHEILQICSAALENLISFTYRSAAPTGIGFEVLGDSGVTRVARWTVAQTIDTYLILIGTISGSSTSLLYVNGRLSASNTSSIGVRATLSRAVFGAYVTLAGKFDVSKPLFSALIDGDLTTNQVLELSKYLNNIFNMGIVI